MAPAGLSIPKDSTMTCVICKTGRTHPGVGTVTLERNETTIVFKKVPAEVCDNCGERYYDQDVTQTLFKTAEEAATAGVQVEVRQYVGTEAPSIAP